MKRKFNNTYLHWTTTGWEEIDIDSPPTYGRGEDFYVDVLVKIEIAGKITGLTFLLAEMMPQSLPQYDCNTVLIVVSDEHYIYKSWFKDLKCIIRSYGVAPQYREGAPLNYQKAMSLIHYIYKRTASCAGLIKSVYYARSLKYLSITKRIFHSPLSCYFRFTNEVPRIDQRSIGYAFLGSVDYARTRKKFLHRFFLPPKIASRLAMLENMQRFKNESSEKYTIYTTGDFEQSILNKENYIDTLKDCKISICPRGSNYETYRYFESIKLGCVIICEALPKAWYYDGHPAVIIKNWKDLPNILKRLLSDPDLMEDLSKRALAHWDKFLSEDAVAANITHFLDALP